MLIMIVVSATVLFTQQDSSETDKLSIVATFYPLAFFAEEIGGRTSKCQTAHT